MAGELSVNCASFFAGGPGSAAYCIYPLYFQDDSGFAGAAG